MSSVKSVAVIGASGNIGVHILSSLLASSSFTKVTAISRASSKSMFPQDANVVRGEYTHGFFVDALRGHDAVVCASASDSIKEQEVIIDAAVEAGVNYFVPSEFGSDSQHPKAVQTVGSNSKN